jgi:hypothetical protein
MPTTPRTITLGGLSSDDRATEDLALPVVTGTEIAARTLDALQDAIQRRTGIVLIGDKGAGKTEATRQACEAFDAAERVRQTLDASYRRRRLLRLPTLVTSRYREVLTELLKQATGTVTPQRVNGTQLSDDTLLARLSTHLFERNVVALIIDHAEDCSAEALQVLRDVMTNAADRDERRAHAEGVIAAGVGMLLVGTSELQAQIVASGEYGHRWARSVEVEGVQPEEVSAIYTTWFPQFAAVIARHGTPWWEATIDAVVSQGQVVAMRSLSYHARRYFAYIVESTDGPMTRERAPLDRDLFMHAAQEIVWQRTTTTGSQGRA